MQEITIKQLVKIKAAQLNKTIPELSEKVGMHPNNFRFAIKEGGNPSVKTIATILKSLGEKFTIVTKDGGNYIIKL